jgi:hypothetical protein
VSTALIESVTMGEQSRLQHGNSPRPMESPATFHYKTKVFTTYNQDVTNSTSPDGCPKKTRADVNIDRDLLFPKSQNSKASERKYASTGRSEHEQRQISQDNESPTISTAQHATNDSDQHNGNAASAIPKTVPTEQQPPSPDNNNNNIIKEKIEQANNMISESFDLVWERDPPDCQAALRRLQQCMKIQRSCLDKHHPDIGWTVNCMGTTHWRLSQLDSANWQQHCKSALKYFLEARRIFVKSSPGQNCGPIRGIDVRMQCILSSQMKWTSPQVSQFMGSLKQMMEHEQQGDQAKAKNDMGVANAEYRKARQLGNILKRQIT